MGNLRIVLIGLLFLAVLFSAAPVFAVHTSSVTIDPNQTKCDQQKTYTVTVTHVTGEDDIREFRIYNNYNNAWSYFACGPPPAGWTLIDQTATYHYCQYQTDDDCSNCLQLGESENFTFDATMNKDSNYQWKFMTLDDKEPQGDAYYNYPLIINDCKPPETIKSFSDPYKLFEGVEWISTETWVELNAVDSEPHPSGIDKTLYLNVLAEDYDLGEEPCWNPQACQPIFLSPPTECVIEAEAWCDENWEQDWGSWEECVEYFIYSECMGQPNFKWQVYSEPFQKEGESCHILEYYSIDNVGNAEDVKVNCFFVDDTPPISDKKHGTPFIEGDGFDWVTQQTPFSLSCEDQRPHPVGQETLYWRFSFYENGFEDDPTYTDWYSAPYTEFPVEIYFPEDSWHDLEYYCVDHLGNDERDLMQGEPHRQYYIVESVPPVITKEMFGSWLGNCPPQEEGDVCYVADDGSSGVEIFVEDPQPHPVDKVWCEYELWWEGQLVDSGKFNDYAKITFYNDSEHTLNISCEDALGNSVEDTEVFLVDSNPPETFKEYGKPFFEGWYPKYCNENNNGFGILCDGIGCPPPECSWAHWISTETPITLTAKDEKVGVDKIYWRNLLVGNNPENHNDICGHPEYYCYPDYYMPYVVNPDDPFTPYTEPFYKEEESCHVIEYYSVDKLGNEERLNWQCVFVDDTAPEVDKEIGEPKVIKGLTCEENGNGEENGGQEFNSVGDEIDEVFFPEGAMTGVGVAFDGEFLYYTYASSSNLYKIRPDGSGHEVIPTTATTDLGALAYDSTRGKIWAGSTDCAPYPDMPIWLIDPATGDASLEFTITLPLPGESSVYCFDDGLAYDATDDTLYFSDDVTEIMGHFQTDGTPIEYIDLEIIDLRLVTNSGIAIGGDNFYLGTDGGEETLRVDKDSLTLLDEFVNTDFRIEDMECDPVTYDPIEVMWIRDAYGGKVKAYEIEPGTCGLGGQPPESECEETYISQQTPITLSCWDIEPHPVDNVSLWYRYRVADDCDNLGEAQWTDWIDPNGHVVKKEIYFKEDSCHELEYYCEDGLGNRTETFSEIDIVDTQAPVIEKTIVGPQYGDCPPEQEGDDCYIDGVTEIHVDAVDPEPHPVNDVECKWYYEVEGTDIHGGQQGVKPPFVIKFPEESTHDLWITCWDALGNEARDYEVFLVDHTPPKTEKEYGEPLRKYDGVEWITSDTNVFLYARDNKSGVAATYWRNTLLVDDKYCWDAELCWQAEGSGQWNTYLEPFTKSEESCHLIEYYSVDNVEKTEEVKKQCVFVDNSAPIPDKNVGEPKDMWTPGENGDPESNFYPEETANCWIDAEGSIECWEVTLFTPISLACVDPEPHPVDHENVCFQVGLDGEDQTQEYCRYYGGDYNANGDDYCCLEHELDSFMFKEESEHNLKYYCEDALGNTGPVDEEKFKVEGTAFKIPLHKKWNLVSVPFVLLNSDPEEVFDDIAEDIEGVWTYDGETNQWYVYTPNNGPDSLTSIDPGWGYWIKAMEDTELLIGGSLFSPAVLPPSRQLVNGWNLIGYYGTEWQDYEVDPFCGNNNDYQYGSPVYCALNSLIDTQEGYPRWSSLWGYVNCSLSNAYWLPLETCKRHDTMYAGKGYWVEMDVPDIYAPATNCIWNKDFKCIYQEL